MKTLEELKISPAPWRIVDSYQFPEGGEWVSVIQASNKKTVSVPTFYNARLIAAAPELYEEQYHDCVSLRTIVTKLDEGAEILNLRDILAKMADRMEAALAEAAGEEVCDGK